ncbi:MAG: hypothetical protein K8F91_10900 [Candidatus Obscuribacterales bacterium]|nr:hypothetical protein [Candidatus Obscuribacterales bacterium]
MDMDPGMMIVIAGVIIMPIIIIKLAKQWKKIKNMKEAATSQTSSEK